MEHINRKTALFIGAIGIQLVALMALGLTYGSIAAQGTDVMLKIAPVDPRDPLRGDYVTFQYDISTMQSYLVGVSEIPQGATVYVGLDNKGGQYWTPYTVSTSLAEARERARSSRSIFLKGTVLNSFQSFDPLNQTFNQDSLRIRYGIEEYFIPEGTGRSVSFWNNEMSALVKVDSNGNAVLRQLFMNGQPWP